MLPERPTFLDSEWNQKAPLVCDEPGPENTAVEHHSQVCPACGNRLSGHRCKLVCAVCGYYMSCADYY